MTTPQHPIGSGFDASSTAADVLRGIDLAGRLAVVTGGYSGLGLEITRALTAAGAHVVVPARRPDVARKELDGIENAEVDALDLGDLDSVRDFAERFLATGRAIDMFIGNAGVMACPDTRVGPGWEAQFATNHLGHYALVNRLWPLLKAAPDGARVVAVSSSVHRRSAIRWNDIHFATGYDKWEAYGQSKTANVLFALHLDTLAQESGSGVRAYSLHPGGILTPLQRHLPREEMVAAGWIDEEGNLTASHFKAPEQGAATATWAATNPKLAGMGGVYCENCDIAQSFDPDTMPATTAGVCGYAVDPEQAARLWTLSAELTGVNAFPG